MISSTHKVTKIGNLNLKFQIKKILDQIKSPDTILTFINQPTVKF